MGLKISSLYSAPPSFIVVIIAGALYLLYYSVHFGITYRRRSLLIRKNGCKPLKALPCKDPIFGTDIIRENLKAAREGKYLELLSQRFTDSGFNTYQWSFWADSRITTNEPENIKTVLATNFKDWEQSKLRKGAMHPVIGHGIFSTDGKEWETSRAMLRPNFVRDQVGDLEAFDRHISMLISHIPKDGSTVDLQPLFFNMTLDSATEFLFGHSTNVLGSSSRDSESGRRFGEAFTYHIARMATVMRGGKWMNCLMNKRDKESLKLIHAYVQKYVKMAIESVKSSPAGDYHHSRYVFLNELVKSKVGPQKLQDEALNILLAGRDTTAGLLSVFFHNLARQPRVFAKLRREIMELEDTRLSFERIKSMRYLKACLNETLRLWPIVPSNGRIAIRDTVLPVGGGPDGKSPFLVKKGQYISYFVYTMHRRKDLYGEDADKFKPERWDSLRPGWEYLPFNGGPRICLGQQLALTEASLTIIRLLQHFKAVEPRDDGPFVPMLSLTLSSRNGCKVGMIPA